jgi:hypothetical protein
MSAFRAVYSDWKLVKTRQTVQIIFEVPLHDADAAYEVLGGMPAPAAERWFGIAALVAGAGGPTASPSMAFGNEKDARNPGGRNALGNEMINPHRKEAGRDEPAPGRPRKGWRDIPPSQQAGIRCDEAVFAAFLKESYPDEWHESQEAAECVRLICAVESRSMLNDGPHRVIWTQLNSQFEAWKALEHA